MVNRWVWESGPGWWERLFKTGFWCGEWSVGLRCLSAPVYISLVMKKVPYFPLKRRSLWSPDLPMSEGQDPGETVKCASPGHVCVEWASRGHRKARGNKGDVRACWTSWQQGQLEARSYLGSADWDRNLWNEMCLPLGFLRFESKTRKCCGALCKCHGRKGRRGLFHWSSLLLPS